MKPRARKNMSKEGEGKAMAILHGTSLSSGGERNAGEKPRTGDKKMIMKNSMWPNVGEVSEICNQNSFGKKGARCLRRHDRKEATRSSAERKIRLTHGLPL